MRLWDSDSLVIFADEKIFWEDWDDIDEEEEEEEEEEDEEGKQNSIFSQTNTNKYDYAGLGSSNHVI